MSIQQHDLRPTGCVEENAIRNVIVREHIDLATNFDGHVTAQLLGDQLVEIEEFARTIEKFPEGVSLSQSYQS